tara:strand:- start:1288 stop:1806 length:519 start_codon:yes stop_codon:yes gene_type:complete
MNIFCLDKDPVKAAQMMCDKHIVKMLLESAQLMCTAHRELDVSSQIMPDIDKLLYKSTHKNHPSAKWVRESAYNYRWLYLHWVAMNDEYKLRYNKKVNHKSFDRLNEFLKNPPNNAPLNKIGTLPTPAMPDECKIPGDVVESYRNYYIKVKKDICTWKIPSRKPDWFEVGIC